MLHSSRHSVWTMLADAAMMSSVHSSRHSLWTMLADAAMMELPLLLVDQHRGSVAAMAWPTLDVPNGPVVHVQELSDLIIRKRNSFYHQHFESKQDASLNV